MKTIILNLDENIDITKYLERKLSSIINSTSTPQKFSRDYDFLIKEIEQYKDLGIISPEQIGVILGKGYTIHNTIENLKRAVSEDI